MPGTFETIICASISLGFSHTTVVTGGRHPNGLPPVSLDQHPVGQPKNSSSGKFNIFNQGFAGLRLG
jgi:hypothetical protein